MEINCPKCGVGFGFIGSNKVATVLPCGDTYCYQCIQNESLNHHEFSCIYGFDLGIKCGGIIDIKMNMPINKLFYEMQLAFKQYQARRQYDNPTEPIIDDIDRFNINYDQKCMNQFCTKLRFHNQNVSELFCSQNCKNVHEQMYA